MQVRFSEKFTARPGVSAAKDIAIALGCPLPSSHQVSFPFSQQPLLHRYRPLDLFF